ncbi:hypothetical protein [Myxococcus xanthus]|uniref:hypothetical protein n=1 Tax=Myxococcus xanthus TaxID=34 RepID=UPI00112788A8|nr:hypothetical protein [Myxococcus xanthus]
MSGGRSARFGFLYSDLVVIRRILEHLLQRQVALIEGRQLPTSPIFYVESTIAPDNAPDWDILEERATPVRQVVLEEVKSGPLKAKDRRIFWRRIRRTVSRMENEERQLIPRLTINRDNPTKHQDRWNNLRVEIEQCSEIPEDSPDFTSAKALAQEAIYHLTHVTDEPQTEDDKEPKRPPVQPEQNDRPLSLECAKSVLGLFEFNNTHGADAMEMEVEDLVGLLSFGLPVKELCANLIGNMYQRATAEDPALRQFTADDVLFSLGALQRLSEVPQEDAIIWQSWSRRSENTLADNCEPPPPPGLPYQDWHEVQPTVAKALENGAPPLLALIGRGGLGKSVLLERLHRQSAETENTTIWITGFDLQGKTPKQVASVLGLGAFVSSIKQESLHVFIDAIENATDSASDLGALVASLSDLSGLGKAHITLSIRSVTWGKLAGSQEKAPRWVAVELSDWHPARVRELVRDSQRPEIGPELLRLLCTPLLLDLFLRTFGVADAVPAGMQTRHAVMSAYWERRILPPENPDSDRRLETLTNCCSEEAKGRSRHTVIGSIAHQLASEGVFSQQNGAWAFRHPLIRDFAMMQWAAMHEHSPGDIVATLESITDSLSRWGAIRAAIEATSEHGARRSTMPPTEELVREMSRRGTSLLMVAAEVLGQIDDSSTVNLGRILDSTSPIESTTAFIERIFDLARLARNTTWMQWVASLPSKPEWAEATPWMGRRLLHLIIEWLDAISRNEPETTDKDILALRSACALRVRNWSVAPKLGTVVAGEQGFNLLTLTSFVAKHLPNQNTLEWLAAIAQGTPWARYATLNALPMIVSRAQSKGEPLDGKILANVYCEAANLARTDSGLCDGPEETALPNGTYMRTQVVLLGHDSHKQGHRGLLRESPEVFLPVAFDILSGFSAAEQAKQAARQDSFDGAVSTLFEFDKPSAEIDEIERQLIEAYPPNLSEGTALAGLIDDTGYKGYATEAAFIINALENLIQEDLETNGDFIKNTYWPAAQNSHSITSWLILLKSLTGSPSDDSDLIDALLTAQPLYFLLDAHFQLHKLLSFRWPLLDSEKREIILNNIKNIARADWMRGMYVVAALASAIPGEDRPNWMHPFFELCRLQGLPPAPSNFESDAHVSVSWINPQPTESDSALLRSPWEEVSRQRLGQLDPERDAFQDALRALKTALTGSLPEPEEVMEVPNLQQALYDIFVGIDLRRSAGKAIPNELELSPDEVRRLIYWSFEVLRRCQMGNLASDRTPVKAHGTPASGSHHPWVVTLEFSGRALRRPEVDDDLELNRVLFEEIGRRLVDPPPGLLWYLFRAISPYHWVRPESSGSGLLKSLLFERVRDPGALTLAFWHAWALGGSDSRRAFHHWLCKQGALAEDGDWEGFAGASGIFLGHCAFVLERSEPNPLRLLVDELLLHPPKEGLLSRASAYRAWCLGVAFGAKDEIRTIGKNEPPGIYADFGLLANSIWERVKIRVDNKHEALFVIYLLHSLEPKPASTESSAEIPAAQRKENTRLLWISLEPTILSMATEGTAADVFSLVSGVLREGLASILDPADFASLIAALHARAVSLGTRLTEGLSRNGHDWIDVFNTGAELIMTVATSQGSTSTMKGRLHEMLQEWATLKIPRAPEMARLIRE